MNNRLSGRFGHLRSARYRRPATHAWSACCPSAHRTPSSERASVALRCPGLGSGRIRHNRREDIPLGASIGGVLMLGAQNATATAQLAKRGVSSMGPGGFAASSSVASTPQASAAPLPTSRLSGDRESGQIPTIGRNFTTAHDILLDGCWGEAAECRFEWTEEWTACYSCLPQAEAVYRRRVFFTLDKRGPYATKPSVFSCLDSRRNTVFTAARWIG